MADLSTLAQTAPGGAAYLTGLQFSADRQQQAAETQRLQALIQGLQTQNQQAQQMNPLLLQHQQGVNDAQTAQLPGLQATSRSLTNKADIEDATKQDDIVTHLAKNHSEVIKNHAEDIANTGRSLGLVAATMMNGTPDAAGPGTINTMAAAMKANNIDPNDEAVVSALKQVSKLPTDKAAQALYKISQNMIKLSEPYMQATDVEDKRAASAQTVEGMRVKGMLDNTQKQIDAGRWSPKAQADVMTKLATAPIEVQYSTLNRLSVQAQQSGDMEAAYKFGQQAAAIEPQVKAKMSSPKPGGIDAGAVAGMPTVAPADITPPAGVGAQMPPPGGGGGQPAPAGGPAPKPGAGTAPPAPAIEMLLKNPSLAAQFDAKYGPGASQKVLALAQHLAPPK